ncbi:hypothetical protein SpCBS45565_g02382 [Spizellomyces sp. 'palustris']|nr:hypothetical protein SpCBS45565_g02382 [Spizellomyces sp. 'palustris']
MLKGSPSATRRDLGMFFAGLVALFGGFGVAVSLIKYDTICRVAYCMDKPVGGDRYWMVLNSVYVFYAYILAVCIATFIIRQFSSLDSFFRRRLAIPFGVRRIHLPFSIGEGLFLSTALGVLLWKFAYFEMYYFHNGVKPKGKNTWMFQWFNQFSHSTGNPLDMFIGFVLIPVSRNSPVATLLKVPFDGALRIHRFFGYCMFGWSVLHAASFFTKIGLAVQTYAEALFATSVANPDLHSYMNLMGLCAFVCFVIAFVPSLPFIRKRHFNTFYILHGFMLVMVLFACLHGTTNFYFAVPGIILWIVDLAIRATGRWNPQLSIDKIVREEPGYLCLEIQATRPCSYAPGQYIFLNIPRISTLEYHPFSLCGSPTSNRFTILVGPSEKPKEWTAKLYDALTQPKDAEAGSLVHTPVHIEGPFGQCGFDVSQADVVACFVTGTGVAPAFGLVQCVEALRRSGQGGRLKKLLVFWSVRANGAQRTSAVNQLLASPLLAGILEFHIFNTTVHEINVTTTNVSSKTLEEKLDERPEIESGSLTITPHRMSPHTIFQSQIIPHLTPSSRLGVFLCAAEGLANNVRDAVVDLKKRDVWVHEESYQF